MSSVSPTKYVVGIIAASILGSTVSTLYFKSIVDKKLSADNNTAPIEEVKSEKLTGTDVELIEAVHDMSTRGKTVNTMSQAEFDVYKAAITLSIKCMDVNLQIIPNSSDKMMCDIRRKSLDNISDNGSEASNRKLLDALDNANEQR